MTASIFFTCGALPLSVPTLHCSKRAKSYRGVNSPRAVMARLKNAQKSGSIECNCHISEQSAVGRAIQSGRRPSKDLASVFGNADRMLELRRQRAVARDGGPTVLQQLH